MKRINRDLIARLTLCAALLLCSAPYALAQTATRDDYPKVEVFVGYSALGEFNSHGISLGANRGVSGNYSGDAFEASVIRNFNKHFGIKGDFSALFNNESSRGPVTLCTPVCTTVTQDFQLKTRVYDFLAGPELKARNRTRFTPLAYALAGVARTTANFTTGPTLNLILKNSANGFAMALGGGLDIRATKRVSFRGTMDYNPVFVNDSSSGTRDLVRFSLGVLIH